MPLSKHHLDINAQSISFCPDTLGQDIAESAPQVLFAYLYGSARDGCVGPHSDLDIAIYLKPGTKYTLDLYRKLSETCAKHVNDIRCDIGVLNHAEPIYRFEVLKGRLLFTRDQETWLRFYSITCREYEHQIVDYERQHRYRLEAV